MDSNPQTYPNAETVNPAINRFIQIMKRDSISYCHWKSNEHLEAGISGETDLDVLFAAGSEGEVDTALTEIGFIRFEPASHKKYAGVSDYINVNPENGLLLHIHAHFRLVIGESGVKSFELPWAADYLTASTKDTETGMTIADPAEELLVLLVRAAIKKRYPMPLQFRGPQQSASAPSDDEREMDWLKAKVSSASLQTVTEKRLSRNSIESVLALYDEGLSTDRLLTFYSASEERMDSFRTATKSKAFVRRYSRRVWDLASRACAKLGFGSVVARRTAHKRGVVVAIMGSDGAGKSTLLASLQKSLSRKIETRKLYLGSGDGPSSLLRLPLIAVRRLLSKASTKGQPAKETLPVIGAKTSKPRAIFNFLWAVTLAHEKRGKLRYADRARRSGVTVICDRYPQTTIQGFNDGPMLSTYADSDNKFLKAVGRWEAKIYSHNHAPQPDLVLKLAADPALLLERRPEMDIGTITRKQQGILDTAFPNDVTVVKLDASASPDVVLAGAMKHAMTALRRSNNDS